MQCANSATFQLWMFLMVFPFKGKSKIQTSKSSKHIYSFLPNFTSTHLRKINWLPVSNRVEYGIANTVSKHWNGIKLRKIHEMVKPPLRRYSTRSQNKP